MVLSVICQILHDKNSSYQILHHKIYGKRKFYRVRSDKTEFLSRKILYDMF